jgi:hypothetical protein
MYEQLIGEDKEFFILLLQPSEIMRKTVSNCRSLEYGDTCTTHIFNNPVFNCGLL